MKYAYNYNLVNIGEHLAPEILIATHCPNHLADKWVNLTHRMAGTQALLHLWHELDGSNQDSFVGWLKENYKG